MMAINTMRQYSTGKRSTATSLCILIYLSARYVQAESLPQHLNSCTGQVITSTVSDLSEIGTVLFTYAPGIEFNFLASNSCQSEYLRINNSASHIVLNKNLTKYCDSNMQCQLECKESSSSTPTATPLFMTITRNASYTMGFRNASYNASVKELASETIIARFSKDQLIMRECENGSLFSGTTFYIDKTPMSQWFTTKGSSTAGIIYSTSYVDYEELNGTSELQLRIRAEQILPNSGLTLSAYTNLTVTIIDVDDMNPVFTKDVYHLNITEENTILSDIPYITSPPIHAFDGDRGINESIIYSIRDDIKDNFTINRTSGEIYVYQRLDADEGPDLYVMIIQATQRDNTLRTATSTLSVSVIEIDDNPPIFSHHNYNCSITEHSAVGQVICRVTASDKDKHLEIAKMVIFIVQDSWIYGMNATFMEFLGNVCT